MPGTQPHKHMKSLLKSSFLLGLGAVISASSAMGAFTFTNGDLIMGFQATGGTGATKNVFFNLGAGTTYRDNATVGSIGNISTTLEAVYGANWYSRTDLYFGVVGNLNQQPNPVAFGSRNPVDGDPSRTFYVSTATSTVASGVLYTENTFAPASLGSAGTYLSGLETILPALTTENDGAAILDQTTKPTEWNNSWTKWNPTPGAAFDTFTGGIQQNFGKATSETYVDLQRILSTNTGASPIGIVGGGTYETTFAIGSNGSISAIPEPSAALLGGLGVIALLRRRRA